MLPCLNTKSVKMLYGTADERYKLSPEFFRQTHYPQVMNQYYKNQLLQQWSEEDLFKELQEDDLPNSNRVYIVFGSTGSGKSELLCWLKDQWGLQNVKRPVIRISRSELNPQLLVKKCYEALGVRLDHSIIDDSKWDVLLKKPVAVVNQIIWTTLSEILESDEQIVPVAFLLRPIIEKNIVAFSKQIKKKSITTPLQIITEQEFEEMKTFTTIPIELKYKTLRDLLIKKLEYFLFHGHNLAHLIKQLSKYLQEQNIRPLLLIDDLVQSVNLYAAEILDHFITLEEGNWDVVVGLTPGVVNGTDYDKEFNQRIQHLDTIDDRVKKLWLSDESGSTFFSLSKDTANSYIENYLTALKRTNGYQCSDMCPHYSNCSNLLKNESNVKVLPLNKHLVERIYDGIPVGKGTLRYMILHTREVLKFLLNGRVKSIEQTKNYIYRNCYIDHPSPLVKLLGEMYADSSQETVYLTGEFLKRFQLDPLDIEVPFINTEDISSVSEPVYEEKKNPTPRYFMDWVEGRAVNENLLDPIKKSAQSIVHEIVKGSNMSKEFTARSVKGNATLQRMEIKNRYKYPISFKEKDNRSIYIDKNVNFFHLLNFYDQKFDKKIDIFSKLAESNEIANWVYKTESIKKTWVKGLEAHGGISLPEFAYGLRQYLHEWNTVFQAEWSSGEAQPFKPEIFDIVEAFYLDWFALRDNVLDYSKQETIAIHYKFEDWILSYTSSKELAKYNIGKYNLDHFLLFIKSHLLEYQTKLEPLIGNELIVFIEILPFVRSLSEEYYNKIIDLDRNIKKGVRGLEQILLFHDIKSWFSYNVEGQGLLQKWKDQNKMLKNMKNLLKYFPEINSNKSFRYDEDNINSFLREDLKIKPRTENHLLKLITTGETKLPRSQWKGILNELDNIHPDLLKEFINVELKVSK